MEIAGAGSAVRPSLYAKSRRAGAFGATLLKQPEARAPDGRGFPTKAAWLRTRVRFPPPPSPTRVRPPCARAMTTRVGSRFSANASEPRPRRPVAAAECCIARPESEKPTRLSSETAQASSPCTGVVNRRRSGTAHYACRADAVSTGAGEIQIPDDAQEGYYDLMCVGSPTWFFKPSVPIHSYLKSRSAGRILDGKRLHRLRGLPSVLEH